MKSVNYLNSLNTQTVAAQKIYSTPFNTRIHLVSAGDVYFSGSNKQNKSSVTQKIKPNIFIRFFNWIGDKIKGFFQGIMAAFTGQKSKKAIEAMFKPSAHAIQDVLDAGSRDTVDYKPYLHTRGDVSKSTVKYTPDNEFVQHYNDWQFVGTSGNYGLKWSRMKIVRDALQNFYDGQGGTLDDTTIDVSAKSVKISASATYDAPNAINIGQSTKTNRNDTVGVFGEGTARLAFVALRDFGATNVEYAADNWIVNYKLVDELPGYKKITPNNPALMAKVTLRDKPIEGNYLKIEVTDPELLEQFKAGKELFFNPNNEQFNNPVYENDIGGFQFTDSNDLNFYDQGQYREISSDLEHYNEAKGLTVWTHKRKEKGSRDRGAKSVWDASQAIDRILEKMTLEEAYSGLEMFKPLWFHMSTQNEAEKNSHFERNYMIFEKLIEQIESLTRKGQPLKKLPFPEKAVAVDMDDEDEIKQLQELGYIPIVKELAKAGVPKASDILNTNTEVEQGIQLKADSPEAKKLEIGKLLIKKLVAEMKQEDLESLFDDWDLEKLQNYEWQLANAKELLGRDTDYNYKEKVYYFNESFFNGEQTFEQMASVIFNQILRTHGEEDNTIDQLKHIMAKSKDIISLKDQWEKVK